MKRILLFLLFLPLITEAQYITTICGSDTAGYTGDGGPAKNAKLNAPYGICNDKYGNIYFADGLNNRIRKINASTGIITTIAGSDSAGFSGDGGPATNARLFITEGICIDIAGNFYFADAGNNRIRKITVSTGIITTVAGSGPTGLLNGSYSGDGGPATNATLNEPCGVCLDIYGNIYIADYTNNVVRKVDASTGIITSVIGKNAAISGAIYVTVDSSGNIYFSDQWNSLVRKLDQSTGIMTIIAGNKNAGYLGDGGLAIYAELNQPGGIFIDSKQNIFIAEYGNGTIRKIDAITGIITTVAGTGNPGYSGDGGPATIARMWPTDVFLDKCGTMYIDDYQNNTIRMVSDAGIISGPYTSICNNRFILNDSIPNGKWSSSNSSVATIDSISGNVHTLSPGSTIISYTTGLNGYGCLNTTTYPVFVGPKFTVNQGIVPPGCYGNSDGSISVTVKGGQGPFEYKWQNGVTSAAIQNLSEGLYVLYVEDNPTNCHVTDSFTVTQPDSLFIIPEIKNDSCNSSTGSIAIAVTGGTGPYTYLWQNNTTDSIITGLPGGNYTVAVTDVNNCKKSIPVVVAEHFCNRVIVHDVITPNGDGINDVWVVEGLQEYPKNSVQVFDSWGNVLFEQNGYNSDWGGRGSSGDLLPDGTYFYLVKLNAANLTGGKSVFTGSLLIRR